MDATSILFAVLKPYEIVRCIGYIRSSPPLDYGIDTIRGNDKALNISQQSSAILLILEEDVVYEII